MSMSNPMYGTLPAFRRPASDGAAAGGGGGGGGGAFMAPPPGASQGGEPGHYPPFQQSHQSPFSWSDPQLYQAPPLSQASSYPPWAYAHSYQSYLPPLQPQPQPQPQPQYPRPQSPEVPFIPPGAFNSQSPQAPFIPPGTFNSSYQPHPSIQARYQAQNSQQPEQHSPWSYGGYPPSPEVPITGPETTSTFNHVLNAVVGHVSPYGVHMNHLLPASAPAEAAPWSQHWHSHQQHQQQRVQEEQRHRPQHRRRNSQPSISPGHVPFSDDAYQQNPPQPFRGSANAPRPRRSAMRRSNSQSAADHRPIASGSQHHTPQIQRHGSAGSGYGVNNTTTPWPFPISPGTAPGAIPSLPPSNVPGYTLPDEDVWSADNLSPRPRDWRADWTSRQGFSSYLPKIGRVRSDVEEYIDTIKRHMHPLIHHSPESDPLAFDLRYKLLHGHTLLLSQLGRQFQELDLAQLAAFPPVPILRLYHGRLPWYVDIHQSHSTGVTVFDVLAQLNLQILAPIHNRHYYNDFLDSTDRVAMGTAYKERIKGRAGEGRKGILQVDFLGDKYVFEGLMRGKQGMWEIKTRRPTSPVTPR